MIQYKVDQNSEEWMSLRNGKFTASTFADLFAKPDTKTFQNAIIKVAYEKVTGECEESYNNKWMQRGHEKEPFARENYELQTFNSIEDAGFFEYDEFTGASPDGKIIGQNGGVEFKCPSFQVYHEYLDSKKIPKSYFWQIHGQLLCTGWDFIDYMPYSSPKLKQILIRIDRDEKVLDELKSKLNECIEQVKIIIERIKL
jgi:hypothetical protein